MRSSAIALEVEVRDSRSRRMPPVALLVALLAGCGGEPPPQEGAPGETAEATPPDPVAARKASAANAAADAAATAASDARLKQLTEQASAPAPAWQPAITPTEPDTRADTLQRAEQAFAAGTLDSAPDSALDLYLSVLESDPQQPEAKAGVARVLDALQQRAELALAERRYADAAQPMPMLLKLRGDEPAIRDLQQRVDAGRELAALLGEAQRLQQAGHLLEPPGDNAAAVFRKVLERDPAEPTALGGLGRLESQLVAQATAAAEAGDYEASDRLLADASRVRPGSGTVQNAGTRIVELRQDRAGQLLEQANAAAQSGDVARAEQLLAQLERVSVQAQGIDELRERIEQARVYGGFQPGQALTETLASGGSAPEMVVIPAGRFAMGSREDEPRRRKNEGPQHEITFTRGFALARTEITVAQFRAFVDATGYRTSAERRGRSTIYDERTGGMAERDSVDWRQDHAGRTAATNLPVVHVSWEDAKAYADWLSRETGAAYRLPSEAEFEYALRAGSTTAFPWGDDRPPRVLANLTGDGDRSATRREWGDAFRRYRDGFWGAAPVRSFDPNEFGVHDIDGNVSEWVEDCWHDNYLRAPKDGSAWVNPGCERRNIRGGSWASAPEQARSAFRVNAAPDASNARVGFRVARGL
jgi:formylglycine-generating enzyme required for sulfatase activity